MLKNIKKILNRNRDFRHVTNNVGKGKKLGLRSTQDEEGIEYHNKEEIEEKVMKHNKMHFSKVKESKFYKDKMHDNINEDNVRDKTLSEELNRGDCDEKSVCKFLSLFKRRTTTQINNTKYLTEEECKTQVKNQNEEARLQCFRKGIILYANVR